MSYLDDVLKNLPSNWQDEQYTNKRFVLIDIPSDSEEYEEVKDEYLKSFTKTIVSVQRIQHPFAYGRFLLQKEQLIRVNNQHDVKEGRHLQSVHGDLSQVETYIDYNCDDRRNKGHSTVNYIVVKKVLLQGTVNRDTHWYPEYLIKVSDTSDVCEDI